MDRYLYHNITIYNSDPNPADLLGIIHVFFCKEATIFVGLLPDNLKFFFVIITFRTVLHHFGRL